MAKTSGPAIEVEEIEVEEGSGLWDLMRAASKAKEAKPGASILPAMLILKSNEVVARIYQSKSEPRTLVVRTCTGIRRISVNVYDQFLMLYRATAMTMQKMEGTSVILLGERSAKDAGQAMIYAMKWTARQFLQPPPRGAKLPETQDSISQSFYLENEKICWLPEATTALQFS
jgi:hypothetical protein